MTDRIDVDPGGLAMGAAAVDGISQGIHLNLDGAPIWADYLSVAGCSGVSAAVQLVSAAMASRFNQQADRMRNASGSYVDTDVESASDIRAVML